ncbi:MAG: hypothetical protein IPL06_21735 [Betaproteobacteria bacterium]|nr:hypothetical protein [Betaproteobacteria bacterium]
MATPAFDPRVTQLAEQIFSQLVRDAATPSPTDTQAHDERLARRSFTLSQAFHRVLDDLNAQNLPKNQDFTMKVEDIAKWST